MRQFIQVHKNITMSKRSNLLIGLAVCLLLLGTSFYPWQSVVTLRTEKFSCDFRDKNFTLQWIHSVERSLWRESYRIDQDKLLLFSSQFKTFGAGTPYQEHLITHDGFIESNPNLIMPQINWIISRNVESTFITPQSAFPLYQYFDDYSEITILVQHKNIWTLLKDSCYDRFTASN